MTLNLLIAQVQKIPEIETEVFWYINKYQDNEHHPWEKYIYNLFLDFDIALPLYVNDSEKQLLVGLTILVCDYEIEQGHEPSSYRIDIEGIGYLDGIKDVNKYLVSLFTELVTLYYQANESDELDNLEKAFFNKTKNWNWHGWVKQEEVMILLKDQLNTASEKTQIEKNVLPQVISDYYSRIDQKRLENLDRFLRRSEEFLNDLKDSKKLTQYYMNIINAINNEGATLKSKFDIVPQYHGIKFS